MVWMKPSFELAALLTIIQSSDRPQVLRSLSAARAISVLPILSRVLMGFSWLCSYRCGGQSFEAKKASMISGV